MTWHDMTWHDMTQLHLLSVLPSPLLDGHEVAWVAGQDPAGGAGALRPAGGGGHRGPGQLGQAHRGEGHQQPHAASQYSLFDLFIFRMLWACGSKIRIILVQNCTVNTSVMTYCIAEGEASLCDINDHWSMMIIASFIDNFTHFNVLSLL